MADLGTIGNPAVVIGGGITDGEYVRVNPTYFGANLADMRPNLSGRIQGVVTENSIPVPGARVLLYWRPSGQLVGTSFTDGDGYYEFAGLIPDPGVYAVVVQDKAGGTQYNDQIKSLTTPG
jgi:hypothetical protein